MLQEKSSCGKIVVAIPPFCFGEGPDRSVMALRHIKGVIMEAIR